MPCKHLDFSELTPNPKYPSLRKLVEKNPKPLPDAARIVSYLKNSPIIAVAPEEWGDIFDLAAPYVGGDNLYTDGEWSWTSKVIYYFEKYHVSLPEAFLEHVRKMYYQPMAVSESELDELVNDFLGGGLS